MSTYDEVRTSLSEMEHGYRIIGAAIRSPQSIYVLCENIYEIEPYEYVASPKTIFLHYRPDLKDKWMGRLLGPAYDCVSIIRPNSSKTLMANNEVFVNGLEVACKAADGKSLAFPDPCWRSTCTDPKPKKKSRVIKIMKITELNNEP